MLKEHMTMWENLNIKVKVVAKNRPYTWNEKGKSAVYPTEAELAIGRGIEKEEKEWDLCTTPKYHSVRCLLIPKTEKFYYREVQWTPQWSSGWREQHPWLQDRLKLHVTYQNALAMKEGCSLPHSLPHHQPTFLYSQTDLPRYGTAHSRLGISTWSPIKTFSNRHGH